MRIKLTSAQDSALDCAGAGYPIDPCEVPLAMCWNDGAIEFDESNRDAIFSAVNMLSNVEDETAEDTTNDTASRKFARGAALALSNLASKILRA